MRKKINKLNEHILIPLLFVPITTYVILIGYLINEYFKSDNEFKTDYLYQTADIAVYKEKLILVLFITIGLITLISLAMKYKSVLFSMLLLMINTVAIVMLIKYL